MLISLLCFKTFKKNIKINKIHYFLYFLKKKIFIIILKYLN